MSNDTGDADAPTRTDLLHHLVEQLMPAMAHAADVLRAITVDPDAPASARVQAARALFELALQDGELAQVEPRLAALEQMVKTLTGDDHAPW
jgi:hypothetical protein